MQLEILFSPASVTKCGLKVESHNTFLELGDGMKMLSRGQAINVPIVTASYMLKRNLTVCVLLHEVDLVLDMTWLVEVDPLIRWNIGTIYLPDSISSFQRIKGDWIDKQVKVGTVKVLSTNEELESLKKPSNIASLKISEILTVLGCEGGGDTEVLEEFSGLWGYINYKTFQIASSQLWRFESAETEQQCYITEEEYRWNSWV